MSMTTFFNEPFYTLSDFDRLFDEAFNARASVAPRAQIENVATRPMRPRYVSAVSSLPSPPLSRPSLPPFPRSRPHPTRSTVDGADTRTHTHAGWTCTRTRRRT